MQFFLKLFKALNSAQRPWQVTLAITMGMIAGLTPIDGIQNFFILFLAFLLNIHLGLFFVSAAFFAATGYLFDPWFEQLGYAVLGADALQGLWTAFYNNGFIRLTHFNNTLVMGATLVSLLLAAPLYALLGWLIGRYRTVLAALLEKRPIFGSFGFLNATTKADPVLRWWGAGLFVVLVGAIATVAILLVDPLLKWAIERGGSLALQRDVRVGDVDTRFGEGAITVQRIEIAGDQKGVDVFSADLIRLDADLGAMLLDKVHIEKAIISGIGFDTPSTLEKSEATSKSKQKQKGSGSEANGFALPAFTFPDPKTLLAKADLKSVKVYDEAQKEIEAIKVRWQKVADEDLKQENLSELQADLQTMKKMSRSKSPKELLKLAQKVKAFKEKIDQRQKQLETLKRDFDRDRKRMTALIQEVQDAPADDYARLKSTYTLDQNGAMNVVGTLFGEKIKGYLGTARKYYTMISPYFSRGDTPPEAALPPRGEGRWMHYPQTVPSPDILIALTELDGIFKTQSFAGSIRDISDNQKALGRPITFKVTSDGPKVAGLLLDGEDNRLGDTAYDRINFKAGRIPTGPVDLKPLLLEQSNLATTGMVTLSGGDDLKGSGNFAFTDATMRAEGLSGKTEEIVTGILDGLATFNVSSTLGGTLGAPTVGVKSDLDRRFSQGLGKAMQKELVQYQSSLQTLLNSDTAERLASLRSEQAGLSGIDGLIGDQNKMLGSLADEAGKLAGGGLGDSLKNVLPF